MNIRKAIIVLIMDILLITELCISIYVANKTPEMLTPVFMKYFFTMCIPTLILAKICVRRLCPQESEADA
jgi:hypothetical protein